MILHQDSVEKHYEVSHVHYIVSKQGDGGSHPHFPKNTVTGAFVELRYSLFRSFRNRGINYWIPAFLHFCTLALNVWCFGVEHCADVFKVRPNQF